MELMMEAMKVKLSACGIGETSDVHNKDPISANQEALVEATSALAFLEASGVPYFVRLKVVQVHHALLSLRRLALPLSLLNLHCPVPLGLPGTVCQAEYDLRGSHPVILSTGFVPGDPYGLIGTPLHLNARGNRSKCRMPQLEQIQGAANHELDALHATILLVLRMPSPAVLINSGLFPRQCCRYTTQPALPPMVILHDGTGCVPPGLREAGQQVRGRGVFAVELPQTPSGTRRSLPAMLPDLL